jgi:hypothetical protein
MIEEQVGFGGESKMMRYWAILLRRGCGKKITPSKIEDTAILRRVGIQNCGDDAVV